MSDDVVLIALSESDYRFIVNYDPERERSASRRDMVSVVEEIQSIIVENRVG
jgi:hypothetical protein